MKMENNKNGNYINGFTNGSMPDYLNFEEMPEALLEGLQLEEPKIKFKLLDDDELLLLPPAKFLIDKLIYSKDVGILVAPSASGKTFIALNLAYSCATGSKFADRFQVNQQMKVLYCCGEGLNGIRNRIEAAKHQFGHSKDKHEKVNILGQVPNLCDNLSVIQFIDEMKKQSFKPDFIMIDTLHTAIPGHDDSSNRDMGLLFSNCKLIRDTFDCVIMLVHHTGKNGEYRGASSLFGDADFFIGIDGDKNAHVKSLVFDKIKDGERPNAVKFELLAKKDSMMVNWLSDDTSIYTDYQIFCCENIVAELKSDKTKWFSASEVAKSFSKGKDMTEDGHAKAVRTNFDRLVKDGFVAVKDGVAKSNGKDIKLYQYLKEAPKQKVFIKTETVDLGDESEDEE